ncbi:MAG: hypothetical protein ACLFNK_03940 [Candidatus Woesearchaeota archaeon]
METEKRNKTYLKYDVLDDAEEFDELDFYDYESVEHSLDDDVVSPEEEGFMLGYMGA